jgi:hypothetical protein
MESFRRKHGAAVDGTLGMFDRMIFKGHLTRLMPRGAFQLFLNSQDVLMKDFGRYVERASGTLKTHAQSVAAAAGRPFVYLQGATTKDSGASKEDRARAIADRDGVKDGLVCVFSVLEPCISFGVEGDRSSQRLRVVRRARKCLHFYFYFLDAEFGLIHVRLQSWFPFGIQVYINGRAWLARQLEREGIDFRQHANAFTWIDDLPRAQALCERFVRRRWPRLLNVMARRVNPMLKVLDRAGFGGYYWCLDQGEWATDVMFRSRRDLQVLYPSLTEYATSAFGAEDVLRFLGRKLTGNFKGEVTTDLKRRQEGRRVKHRMKRNTLKMYDKHSVLRIETTINNPSEFKVLRVIKARSGSLRRWWPMGKGVANIWRYAQVSELANHRYLEALACVQPKGKVVAELDRLCRPRILKRKRVSRFAPFTRQDNELFQAVLAGDHTIRGFRNGDLQERLYRSPAHTRQDRRRRSARISRLIRKLRAHQLVAKVPGCRRYTVTARGYRLMATAVRVRNHDYPLNVLAAA